MLKVFVLSLLLLIPFVNASFCINNNTLGGNITIDGTLHYYNRTCEYGCEQDDCTPSPLQQFLIIIGVIVAILFIIIVIKKAGVMK